MTSKLDWTVHDIHLTLLNGKAVWVQPLEVLDKPEFDAESYMRGHFRARVGLASDILNMLYKDDLVMKEE